MARPHHIDRVEAGSLATRQPPPQIQARNPHQYGEHAMTVLHTSRVPNGTEPATAGERCDRTAITVLADAVEDDVEPARQDAREVLMLIVDRRRAQFANQCRMFAARGAPQLDTRKLAED